MLEIAGHSKVIGDIPLLYLHPPLDVSAVGSGVEDDVGGAAYRMITVMVKARERRIRLAAPGGRVTRDKSYIGQRRCTEISTLMRSLQLVFRF